ncbi:hypothetical protein [Pseudomonas sp.]|uniref:hypothetical protein n=1 Tax=Pseudomonas sp. TaxID=306 RepID=UPI0026097BB7|nr:hypothetical protein [Pseudomonas sp.]
MDMQVAEDFVRLMKRLGEIELFHDGEDWVEPDSVWKRPLRPQAFPYTTFDSVTQSTLFNYSSLTMNRTLTALYEQDFLYLPATSNTIIEDLKTAYSTPLRRMS